MIQAPLRVRPGAFSSASAQARHVAAQVDSEIARQVMRRSATHANAGTLLLLPVQVERPSVRARAVRVLRRLFNSQRDSLLSA